MQFRLLYQVYYFYDLIEVKKDRFGGRRAHSVLNYEARFTQRRTKGDRNMVRSIAIAKSSVANVPLTGPEQTINLLRILFYYMNQ